MAKKKIKIDSAELLNNFRTARHKREQIEIEADLHLCSPRTIAEVLDRLGALEGTGITPKQFEDVYHPIPPAPGRRPYKAFDEARALELYRAGVGLAPMSEELHVAKSTLHAWFKREGLTRPAPKPGPKPKQAKEENAVKKERPTEEALLDKETEQERCERILASVDAGKRAEPPDEAPAEDTRPGYTVPLPARDAAEPMTVGRFVRALGAYLSAATERAELRVNGKAVSELGFEIRVKNERVFVDLRTREAG